jgi:hypothetical protein
LEGLEIFSHLIDLDFIGELVDCPCLETLIAGYGCNPEHLPTLHGFMPMVTTV